MDFISYQEALQIIGNNKCQPHSDKVSLQEAYGKVLNETIYADRDFPPFDRVTMDGIAIDYAAFESGQRTFSIEKTIAAGMPKASLEDGSKCVQIMTGAIMPNGVDTVIRYEDISIAEDVATINEATIRAKQNVHFQGIDKKQGDIILSKGKLLGAPEMNIAAAVGKDYLDVLIPPKAMIITTGDELVSIHDQPEAHQIRRSGNYGVRALIENWGAKTEMLHLPDDKKLMTDALSSVIKNYQLVVLTGGVSKGKFDFLPEVMQALGVKKHFHKVKQRPGKPFWFGTANNGTTVFALPGNPVSSFMCAAVYIRRWLSTSLSLNTKPQYAVLKEDVSFPKPFTYFMECESIFNDKGQLETTPSRGNGSGDFANMVDADGFIVLPEEIDTFEKGQVYPFISYRNHF
jgi:molybdopterin molybdotransferase